MERSIPASRQAASRIRPTKSSDTQVYSFAWAPARASLSAMFRPTPPGAKRIAPMLESWARSGADTLPVTSRFMPPTTAITGLLLFSIFNPLALRASDLERFNAGK